MTTRDANDHDLRGEAKKQKTVEVKSEHTHTRPVFPLTFQRRSV